MKRAILTMSLATLAALAASAAVPVRWTVDTSRPKVAVFDSFHGETLALEATFQTDGKPLEMTGNAKLCWQTNGMDAVWWTADATISNNVVSASFLPTMDPGASQLIAFLGVPGEVWRAEFRLRFRSSPGASPNEIELPVKTLDFSQVEVSNAPWLLASDAYSKAEVDSKVSTAVSAEATRAKNAEAEIKSLVDTNASAISAETTRATKAEQTNASAISAETTRATKAESEIKSLADTNATAISKTASDLTSEISRAKAAEQTLTTSIQGETTRAKNAEAEIKSLADTNASAISAEAIRAKAAEQTNASAISAETTRATKAESEIKSLADSHISDTNNPHGVTALQVGALPAFYSNNQFNVTNEVNLEYAYVTGGLYRKRTIMGGLALSKYLSSDELVNQYVASYQTINGHSLSNRNITVTAADVGAYAKADTYTKTEIDSKVAAAAPADYTNVSNLAYTAVQSRFAGVNFIDTTNTFFSSKSNPDLGFQLDGYVNEVEEDPTVSAWAKADTKPTYTASEVGAVPTTRKVNSKALSSDITLSASDVGAYAKADTYTKTEAAAQFYPKTEGELWESWWSGDGFRVSVTNYNVEVTDSTAWERLPTASFDYKPDETATAYTAVWNENTKWDRWFNHFNAYTNETAASLDNKADRAWGNYDSTTGLEAPEGYTWISSEHVALSAGLAYQKFITTGGAVWVLTSNGLTTETSGVASNAFFRVADDTGKALFEIVKGDKVTVGANVDGITVDNNANPITVTISYPVESAQHPSMEATAALGDEINWQTADESGGAFTESWSGSSGSWTNTITLVNSPTKYFFRAYYQKGGDTYINNSAPVALQKIVLGGVTYSITVEDVNGKKLMVLTEAN